MANGEVFNVEAALVVSKTRFETGVRIVNDELDSLSGEKERERLGRIFSRTNDGLYRFILTRVGRDRSLADDLLQQTCCVAVQHQHIPEQDEVCESWLFGIAYNLLRRHWRTNARRRARIVAQDDQLSRKLLEEMVAGPLPEEIICRDETAEQLLLAVTSLESADQFLIFAFYFEGRSQSVIALQMGVTVKSVETRLCRVRSRLRARLKGNKKDERKR